MVELCGGWIERKIRNMHYPRRLSKVKRMRKQGFRARMRTAGGRKVLSRKRRRGNHRLTILP